MVTRVLGAVASVLVLSASAHAQNGMLGREVFETKGNCSTCHGPAGRGTGMAPSLRDTVWLNIDGSVEQITHVIHTGVPRPKIYPGMMPPTGGAKLSAAEIAAVAQYVADLRKSFLAADHSHSDTAAAADITPRQCGCCQMHGRMHGMQKMRGRHEN